MAAPQAKARAGAPGRAGSKSAKEAASTNPIMGFLKRLNSPSVSISDVSIFSRQFSTMINAGLPVLQCLSIIADQQDNATFKKVITAIKDDIGSGGNLSDAMAKHPKIFDELYVNMIRSGELGGVLDAILERLSIYMEKAEALRRKIKAALMYPSIVVSVAVLVIVFLMVKVIPTFQEVFEGFGHALPPLTQFVVNISNFMQHEWYVIGGAGVGLVMIFNVIKKTPKGRLIIDGLSLKIPVFGLLLKKAAVAKFSRTLGTLLRSGVPILEALETVAKTSGNKVVEGIIDGARASIREGQGMTEPLRKDGIFPPMVLQMISVGEETGKIDDMLMRAGDFYEEEVDTAVEGLSSILEPIIIVFLGISIGTIVVAMFLPMFDMGNVVSS